MQKSCQLSCKSYYPIDICIIVILNNFEYIVSEYIECRVHVVACHYVLFLEGKIKYFRLMHLELNNQLTDCL